MSQAAEDMKRELEKQQKKGSTLEEQVNEKIEKLEEEHFKLSRLQVGIMKGAAGIIRWCWDNEGIYLY